MPTLLAAMWLTVDHPTSLWLALAGAACHERSTSSRWISRAAARTAAARTVQEYLMVDAPCFGHRSAPAAGRIKAVPDRAFHHRVPLREVAHQGGLKVATRACQTAPLLDTGPHPISA